MIKNLPKELLDKNLISQDQFEKIDLITSGKIVSVFYELRTLLYLGVMLFTTGAGILIYQNIGELGHLISIILLSILCAICFWYVAKHAAPYSNLKIKWPTPYFDYVLLLGSLLFVSILGYLQFQYAILDENLGSATLVSAILFFFLAYRYDHAGVLSLGITAFTSFWGISVSPQRWYSSSFWSQPHLHIVAIVIGIALMAAGVLLNKRDIKKHFTFTYLNFGLMLFFFACVAGLFIDDAVYGIYLLLIYGGCAFSYYAGKLSQSFLFLLYAFIAAYIGTTYLLAETLFREDGALWFYYSILSCGGFVYFVIKFKNHFRQEA